jgi:hypothetical protein
MHLEPLLLQVIVETVADVRVLRRHDSGQGRKTPRVPKRKVRTPRVEKRSRRGVT